MRTKEQRIAKFKKKLDGDVAKHRIDSYEKQQKRNFAAKVKKQVKIEVEVKNLVGNYDTLINLPYYIIFGKEVNMLMGKHQSESLFSELEILQEKWINRGLNTSLLNDIKTYYVQAYKPIVNFRLDISLLDGPDILA